MLARLNIVVLLIAVLSLFCFGCTETDDGTSAMAESISNGTVGGELVTAGLGLPEPEITRVDLGVGFTSAMAPETKDGYAKLGFAVEGAPDGKKTMALANPKSPEGTEVELPFCDLDIAPKIIKAKTSGSDKCSAFGGYCVELTDKDGKMMGAFEIKDDGTMVIATNSKVTSYQPRLSFSGENKDGDRIDRFMIFPKNMGAGDTYAPLMAIEYRQAEEATEHEFSAPDGYDYTYKFHDGQLRVYPPNTLEELADEAAADTRAASKTAGGSVSTACSSGSGGGG
ncbi:hypothetical protein JW859_12070 [bacterium]|nr:hypothetical protein [bacterium]